MKIKLGRIGFALSILVLSLPTLILPVTSCASDVSSPSSASSTGGTGSRDAGDAEAGETFADFPATPTVASGELPPGVGGLFTGAPGGDGPAPCLTDPPDEAMVPKNWTPLSFEWAATPELNVFELKITVDNQTNPLVVYTSSHAHAIDATLWKSLCDHSAGHPISIALRGGHLEGGALTMGPTSAALTKVFLAPVPAPGFIVYWKSRGGGVALRGFAIGDTKSKLVLTPAKASPAFSGSMTSCVSCHEPSPDGKLLFYTRDTDDGVRAIDVRNMDGGVPPADAISGSALALLGRNGQAAPVFSPAHASPGDSIVLSTFSDPLLTNGRHELIWTDLHASDVSRWGVLARNGDPRDAASPSWRHDGTEIAYVSAANVSDGVIADVSPTDPTLDVYTVPYNDRTGGDAKPLVGASDPVLHEFYPSYSPDDTLLVFDRTDQSVNSYDEPSAELFVVPSVGGSATRLRANDPSGCVGLAGPGLTNSWPRWAPDALVASGLTYHWLVFSSKRRPASHTNQKLLPQLYIAAVVTRFEGGVPKLDADYPALYVTAQDPDEDNLTPAWGPLEPTQAAP